MLAINKFFDLRGGTERVLFDLDAGLREAGHQTVHFAQQDARNRSSDFAAFFPPARDYDGGSLLSRLRRAQAAIYDGEARRYLGRLLNAHPVDVAHLHNIYHQLSPSILGELRRHGIPTLMTVHDYKLVCPNYRLYHHGRICELCVGSRLALHPLRTRCQRDSRAESALVAIESTWHRLRGVYLRGVDCFVAPSQFLAAMLKRQGYPADRIEVIPNAPRQRAAPAPASLRDERPTLFYAGRLSEEKGVAMLIETVRSAPPWQLRIAGDGPLASELRARAQDCERIQFLGQLDANELGAERARAWAVALPSLWYENAPLALLEAYASARPVLVSDHGGLVELVDEGVEGKRLPPGDAVAWRAALLALASQPAQLASMGEAGWRRLQERHDFAHFVSAHVRLYERLLQRR